MGIVSKQNVRKGRNAVYATKEKDRDTATRIAMWKRTLNTYMHGQLGRDRPAGSQVLPVQFANN